MARLAFGQACARAVAGAPITAIGHRNSLTAEEMERLIEPDLPLTLADLLAWAVHEAGAAEVGLREAVAGSVITGRRDNLAASKVARRHELEGMTGDELDEIVHDLKAEEASEINNAGREDQIAYILEVES